VGIVHIHVGLLFIMALESKSAGRTYPDGYGNSSYRFGGPTLLLERGATLTPGAV